MRTSVCHCAGVQIPPGKRTRIMKANAFSIFFLARSPRRSRSSCRYMPWNFTSCASSSEMAPVTSARSPSSSVPRRYALASLMRSTREGSFAEFMERRRGSVDVLNVAAAFFELAHRGFGGIGLKPLHVGERPNQGFPHVLRHVLGVAADVEIRAVVEPIDEIAPLVPHAMLHVDLLGCIARERVLHAGQRAVGQRVLPFELIEKIMGEAAVAEEQPAAAACRGGAALLHERPERRNAGSRSDHDDVPVRRGQREMPVRPQLYPQAAALVQPFGDMAGSNPGALAAVTVVAHRGDEEMRLVRDLALRGGDRIGARAE